MAAWMLHCSFILFTQGIRRERYSAWLFLLRDRIKQSDLQDSTIQVSPMPLIPVSEKSSKSENLLRTTFTPPQSVSKKPLPPDSADPINPVPFAVMDSHISADGDELQLQFSDQTFTFLAWWLYLSRKSEGLPSPDGCKNPSKILVKSVKISGIGIRATVDITWNTGTTSLFPALLLRVFGPTKALEQGRCEEQVRGPGGRNPRSGVGLLTVEERRVAERYRAMLVERMKEYMDEEWILTAPTSLLRGMVRYVDLELQSESQEPAAVATRSDAAVESSSDVSLVDEVI